MATSTVTTVSTSIQVDIDNKCTILKGEQHT